MSNIGSSSLLIVAVSDPIQYGLCRRRDEQRAVLCFPKERPHDWQCFLLRSLVELASQITWTSVLHVHGEMLLKIPARCL